MTTMNGSNKQENGQSLVQLLVSIAITGIVLTAMTSMMSAQLRETRHLTTILAAADLARAITATLASADSCKLLFTKPTNVINSANLVFNDVPGNYPIMLDLQSIPASDSTTVISRSTPVVSSLSNDLKLRPAGGIEVQVTSATTANLSVHFDQSNLIRPIKDLTFPLTLGTVPSGTSKQIVGCQAEDGTLTGVWSPCTVKSESSIGGFANYPHPVTTWYAATDVANCVAGQSSDGKDVIAPPPITNNTVPFSSTCLVSISVPSGIKGVSKTTSFKYTCLAGKWIQTAIITDPNGG
jgi:hypothetical protein